MNTQMNSARYASFAAMVVCLTSFVNAQTVEKRTLTCDGKTLCTYALVPEFRVNSTVVLRIWPKIQIFS